MPSTFECAPKNIVKELSKNGELIPVDSLKSSTHFSPYYLVRRKNKSSWFWRPQYVWLNVTLKDILDPSSPEPEVIQNGPFHFNDEVDGQVSGRVEVTAFVQAKLAGQTSVSNRTDLEVRTLIVPLHTWDCLQKERPVLSPSRSFLIIADLLLLPHKKQKTFPPKRSGSSMESGPEFEKLQAEVKKEESPLIVLDKNLRQCLLQDLLELLQSEEGLVDLQDMLVESLFSGVPPENAEGVMGNIFSNLQDQNGQLVEELAGSLLYLLGALNALSEIQYEIMILFLKTKEKILPQEVDLVTEILKKNFHETTEVTFSLPSELLSFAKDKKEESTLIYVLLEECGLEISGDKSQFTWNPDALYSLCALYGSLGMLQALSKDC